MLKNDDNAWLFRAALIASALTLALAAGCAASAVDVDETSTGDPTTTTTSTSAGGMGGTSSTGGMGGDPGACGTDCSLINTPQCQVAQCNVQTGQCEVVNDVAGVACDDGLFCTISDSCSMGTCVGGPQNDCGMAPPQCTEVTCDEMSMTCSSAPAMNGAACQDPNDLCLKGSTCSNGLCIGGQQDDCFFFPVPSDCHVASCNPMSGMCEAQTGNQGGACNDLMDLCTVQKTCDSMGMCVGGVAKDCSNLTVGCTLGLCDVNTGQCQGQAVMNGQACDDLNNCTSGEICTNMTCGGGTTTTQCINNDNCCPMNCNENNDTDCGGVFAFNEFRPEMKCADFANNGPSYQRYCFTLKNQTLCTGQHASGQADCIDTTNGVKFVYDFNATWPMRFTPNTQTCMNYHPQFIQNFAFAIGYSNYTINQTKTGNSCTRTWIDNNGIFQQTSGDSSQAQIYDIDFWN
jgi:hypothetical protein